MAQGTAAANALKTSPVGHAPGRWSNGRLEGTNNLLERMGFGFVNAANFEARGIFLTQGPDP